MSAARPGGERRGLDHVLEVVEEEQRLALVQGLFEQLDERCEASSFEQP